MKHLLSASIFALAASWSLSSQAATVEYKPLPADGTYYAPKTSQYTGTFHQGVTGNDSDRTSPFSDSLTPYDSVSGGGSATFGQGPSLESLTFSVAYKSGSPASDFGSGTDTFSFVWGTPDSYNTLSFYENGQFITSVTGAGAPNPPGLGSGSYLATVSGLGNYNGVVFSSNQNAFEFAAVSPVPLPASLPMFGLALLGLGGVAFARQRRGKSVVSAL